MVDGSGQGRTHMFDVLTLHTYVSHVVRTYYVGLGRCYSTCFMQPTHSNV